MKKELKNKYYNLLLTQGFFPETAKYIFAQAAFETNNFESKIYLKNNNLFGMRHPKSRETLSLGSKYGYALYSGPEASIADFKLYYKALRYPQIHLSIPNYVQDLKNKGYFEGNLEKYQKGVIYWYNFYFNSTQDKPEPETETLRI